MSGSGPIATLELVDAGAEDLSDDLSSFWLDVLLPRTRHGILLAAWRGHRCGSVLVRRAWI